MEQLKEERKKVENNERKVTDYKIIKIIGTGTFGKVYVAQLDGLPVALKALKKTYVIQLKQVEHIKNEKGILAEIDNPFIVNM